MFAGIAAWMAACTIGRSPVTGDRRLYGFSFEQAQQIGARADKQIIATYGIYRNEDLAEYVKQVGHRVLQHSDLRGPKAPEKYRESEFTFRVLSSPVVNAFALPGGYVYVTRGLLAHLQNEAQLAVVLGHEIGHVAARHAAQSALESQLGQIGLIAGAILGQEVLGVPAQQILNIGSTATQLLFLKYSREDEQEADYLGVKYAAQAGYKVSEAAAFFRVLERLQAQAGAGLPTWLSTHPDPGGRQEHILELAERFRQELQLTILDQPEYLGHIEDIVVGEDPRQGYVLNNVFYHPGLRFQFEVPPEWRVVNQAAQVSLLAPGQRAAAFFGIVEEAESVEAAAHALVQQSGIQVISAEPAQINGLPAYAVLAEATANGQLYRLVLYTIGYNDAVYRFIGYSAAGVFSSYRPVFHEIIYSFRPITDPDRINVEPLRLRIEQADRTAPFDTFIPEQLPRGFDPQSLAILNQVELNETIQPGQPIKKVE